MDNEKQDSGEFYQAVVGDVFPVIDNPITIMEIDPTGRILLASELVPSLGWWSPKSYQYFADICGVNDSEGNVRWEKQDPHFLLSRRAGNQEQA